METAEYMWEGGTTLWIPFTVVDHQYQKQLQWGCTNQTTANMDSFSPRSEGKHHRRNQPWPCLGGSLAMDNVEYRTEMCSNEVSPSHSVTTWYHDDILRQGLLPGPARSPPYLVCQKANLLMQIYVNQNANSSCKVETIPLTYTYIK